MLVLVYLLIGLITSLIADHFESDITEGDYIILILIWPFVWIAAFAFWTIDQDRKNFWRNYNGKEE